MKKGKDAPMGNALSISHDKYTTLQGKTQVIRELFNGKNPLYDENEL